MQLSGKHQQYWRKNLRLTGILLSIWFAATFATSWYARELQSFTFLGFPISFYMAAQGSLLIYLGIIWYYARTMNDMDREFGVEETGQ